MYDLVATAPGYDAKQIFNIEVGSGEEARSIVDILLEESLKPAPTLRILLTVRRGYT